MKRLSQQEKIQVAKTVEDGGTIAAAGRQFGVSSQTARRCYLQYQQTGTITTSTTTKRWPEEFKASAVQYMRENGLSSEQAGIELGVTGHNTLDKWEKALMDETPKPTPAKRRRKPILPLTELDALKRENELLKVEIAFLRKMEELAQQDKKKEK